MKIKYVFKDFDIIINFRGKKLKKLKNFVGGYINDQSGVSLGSFIENLILLKSSIISK